MYQAEMKWVDILLAGVFCWGCLQINLFFDTLAHIDDNRKDRENQWALEGWYSGETFDERFMNWPDKIRAKDVNIVMYWDNYKDAWYNTQYDVEVTKDDFLNRLDKTQFLYAYETD